MLTVFVSTKSENVEDIKRGFTQVGSQFKSEIELQRSWDTAQIIWKPTAQGIEPAELSQLKFFNNFLTSHITLTEKTSLLKSGMNIYGSTPKGFFDLAPYNLEYRAGIPLDIYLPHNFNSLTEYDRPGLGNKVWITKPGNGFGGTGIELFSDRDTMIASMKPGQRTIIQKYIENPLLMDGRKFDIRVYVLVTSDRILYYRDGFVRLAPEPFDLLNLEVGKHLTNLNIHRSRSIVLNLDDLNRIGITRDRIYQFMFKLKPLFQYAQAVEQCYKQNNKINFETFELFGIDMMFDSTGNPWLLEINKSPGALPRNPGLIENTLKEAIFFKLTGSRQPTDYREM